ncbi:MAG TPA: phosphatase PAP2 family protein [Steroidobacteraceae bacterium]|nr:phosphatase PAP2 family protein [Steroidobacteraceae bacterium]
MLRVRLALPLIVLALAGCTTLPSRNWGQNVTVAPGWARVGRAAASAASDPWVWGPLAGATVLQVGNLDHRISRWGRTHTPVFGSNANATSWSYTLRSASVGMDIAAILFAPSGHFGKTWLEDKAKGYLVNLAAATTAIESNTLISHEVRRERPNRANDHSFPSNHTTASAVYTRLAMLNLEHIPMNTGLRDALDAGLHGLTFATAWARIEGGWHYPSDTLFGMALGNFSADFFTRAFMGFNDRGPRLAFSPLPGGGLLTFSVALDR